jgi:hypothetical protein
VHIVPIECTLSLALYYLACDVLCIGFLDDGARLYGSTLPYNILVVDVLFLYD